MCPRDSGMLCLRSCWFLRTSLFLPSFYCLSSQHSRVSCSVSIKLCGSELVSELSSNLIAPWSERLFVMISVLLHLLRSDLLPIMWSILE